MAGTSPHRRLSSSSHCSLVLQYFEVVSGTMVTRAQFQGSFQVPFCLRIPLHLNEQCSCSHWSCHDQRSRDTLCLPRLK